MAYINEGRPIYITYARNGKNPGWEHISDIEPIIVEALRHNNIDVYDDEGDLKPGGKITAFEEAIGHSEFTILIFSDKYFRSHHCMYEFAQIKKAIEEGIKQSENLICIKSGNCKLDDATYIEELRDYWADYAAEKTKIKYKRTRYFTPIEVAAEENGYYADYISDLYAFFNNQKYLYADNPNLINDIVNTFKSKFGFSHNSEGQYYLAINDNQHEGPLGLSEIKRTLRSMPKETLVWKPGIPWTKAIDVPELSSVFPIVPPPIPKFASSARVIERGENNIITPDPHPAVDLGLSVLWADRNIGADNPWDYGDYFAWGETETKDFFDWDNYKYANGDYDDYDKLLTKYCNDKAYGNNGFTDNLKQLQSSDDIATVTLGKGWRMPTIDEFKELVNNCKTRWVTNYHGKGVYGYKFKGKNGNHIFLPAAGFKRDMLPIDAGSVGYYWSLSLDSDDPLCAHHLCFYADAVHAVDAIGRFAGCSVRAVRRKN